MAVGGGHSRWWLVGVAWLAACGVPLQAPDAFRVDDVSPLAGTEGTRLTLEGLLPEAAAIEVCGVPLEDLSFSGQERVTVGPGLGGLGSGFGTVVGTLGDVPFGEVCQIVVRVNGRDVPVGVSFVTDPVASYATTAGGASSDTAYAVSVLSDGSAVVAGIYSGTASFGSTTLSSAGSGDAFVAKVAADGSWVWATSAGGVSSDGAHAVSVLSDGSAVVAGVYQGTASFGSTTLTSSGAEDAFVAKVDAAGAWVWATSVGGATPGGAAANDVANAVSVLSDGSAVVAGIYSGTASFGSTTLTSTGVRQTFVAKVDADGSWVWATSIGDGGNVIASSVSASSDGGAVVAGLYPGSASFGSTTLTSSGALDAFIAKVDADGAWVWATSAGGASSDAASAVSVSPDGSALVAGYYADAASFGSTTLTSSGAEDAFVAKMDADGAWVWATSAGGASFDRAESVSVSPDGGAVVAGFYATTASFGSATLTSSGAEDAFVAKVDADGSWVWATSAGGASSDAAYAVSVLSDGSAVAAGFYSDAASFGSTSLVSEGQRDVFVAKLGPDGTW